ncbi:MAG: hypothetical protein JWL88_741 [Parcubacteria group bacterium]|nr:hypothetical protein [Parcubacteria group bacterium]
MVTWFKSLPYPRTFFFGLILLVPGAVLAAYEISSETGFEYVFRGTGAALLVMAVILLVLALCFCCKYDENLSAFFFGLGAIITALEGVIALIQPISQPPVQPNELVLAAGTFIGLGIMVMSFGARGTQDSGRL